MDECSVPTCTNQAEPDNGHMGNYEGMCYQCGSEATAEAWADSNSERGS